MSDPVLVELELADPRPRIPGIVPTLWIAIVALLAAGIAAPLLGVGRKDEPPAGQRLAAAAAAATAEDFAFEVEVSVGADPVANLGGKGAIDIDTMRLRATLSFGPLTDTAVEIVQDGAMQYLKAEGAIATAFGATAEKPWVRIDIASLVGAQPASPGTNPLDLYRQLGAITAPVVRVGEEDVRGEPTVHFRTAIDGTKTIPEGRTVPNIEALRAIAVDVWLDEDNRPRRIRQSITIPIPSGGSQKIVTTVEAFDFGRPVTVELPPANQVTDAPAGLGGLLPTPSQN